MASKSFPGKMLRIPLGFVTLLIKHKHIMILETFCFPKMLKTAENTVKTTVDPMHSLLLFFLPQKDRLFVFL